MIEAGPEPEKAPSRPPKPQRPRKYYGFRTERGPEVLVVDCDGVRPIVVENGIEWGYLGAGPTRLAREILRDAISDAVRAQRLVPDFLRTFVANLPHMGWVATREEVLQAVWRIEEDQEKEARRR